MVNALNALVFFVAATIFWGKYLSQYPGRLERSFGYWSWCGLLFAAIMAAIANAAVRFEIFLSCWSVAGLSIVASLYMFAVAGRTARKKRK
ncbi:hypothetical protein JW899_05330 [Candidatus Uhrbacteria bacterium]|nr:hypothetical protein [Candidatus Uhrbacteria bacterium]